MTHKLSVVIPCFNHEKYLTECVESIWRQEVPSAELELVVLDDCSTDNSFALLLDLQKRSPIPMIVEKNEKNLGCVRTITKAISRSTGDFLTFFATDDRYGDDAFSEQMKLLTERPEMKICFANGTSFGDVPQPYVLQSPFAIELLGRGPRKVFDYISSNVNVLYLQSAILRREFFEKIGGYDLDTKIEDWALTIKIFKNMETISEYGFVNKNVTEYRVVETSRSRINYSKHYDEIIELFKKYTPEDKLNKTIHDFCLDRASYCIRYLPSKSPMLMFKYLLLSQAAIFSPPSLKLFWAAHKADFKMYLSERRQAKQT